MGTTRAPFILHPSFQGFLDYLKSSTCELLGTTAHPHRGSRAPDPRDLSPPSTPLAMQGIGKGKNSDRNRERKGEKGGWSL